MLTSNERTRFFQYSLMIEYLQKIAQKYPEQDFFQRYIHDMTLRIRDKIKADEIYLFGEDEPASAPAPEAIAENSPGFQKAIQSLNKHKTLFRPDEWYFLKALLFDDRDKFVFLLQQALAVCPENAYCFCFIFDPEKYKMPGYLEAASCYRIHSDNKLLNSFFSWLNLLLHIRQSKMNHSASVVLEYLNGISLSRDYYIDLLFDLAESVDTRVMLDVMEDLKTSDIYTARVFSLIKGRLNFVLKQYALSAQYLKDSSVETLPFSEGDRTFYLNMLAWSYNHTGREKEALGVWEYMAKDPERRNSSSGGYSDALIRVAQHYHTSGRIAEAKQILENLPGKAMETMYYKCADEYYDLLGDLYKAEQKYAQAMEFYRRALKFSPASLILQNKVEELKKIIRLRQKTKNDLLKKSEATSKSSSTGTG